MNHQELRNALCDIEDRARRERNTCSDPEINELANLIVHLAQIIRQEIVK